MARARKEKLTAKAAVEKVLGDAGKPMGVPAIIAAAVPLTNLGGKTPGQSIYSVLYTTKSAPWVRTGRGTFKLAAPKKKPTGKKPAAAK